jgi:dienelactone hydrolase
MWTRPAIALILVGDHSGEAPLRTAVTGPAAVALVFWCIASFLVADALAASLERVEFEGASKPLTRGDRIQAFLAKPDGTGPFPAVIGLHGCGGMHETTKQKLADDLVAWGYVTLLVDSFATRDIDHACTPDRFVGIFSKRTTDAYGALAFLARQPFVDTRRVAAVGFSQGAGITLSVAATRSFEPLLPSDLRFRAAVAFYPPCRTPLMRPEIPTLIFIGALDDWTPSEYCSRRVDDWGTEGPPIEYVVYPGTHHSFYYPHLQPGRKLLGHWVQYNGDAADDASDRMRRFLNHHLN